MHTKNTRVHNMCTLICFMIPRAMFACTKYVTASYHAYSGAESGKTGEASKSAAVFTPVDNDILELQFVVVKKRNVKNKKEQKRSSVSFRLVWQRSRMEAAITKSCRLKFRNFTLRLKISGMIFYSRKAPGL